MIARAPAPLLAASGLLLASACATTSRHDIAATFAQEGLGQPKPLVFQLGANNAATIGPFQIGSLPDTKPGEYSIALADKGEVIWVGVGKTQMDRSGDTMRVNASYRFNSAKTATRAWTLDLSTTENFRLVGTISGPEPLEFEAFPADRSPQGMYVGWDGGYLLRGGKILAAFDWIHPPEQLLVSDGMDEDTHQLVVTIGALLWAQKHELDKVGRSSPRSPPLGKLNGASPNL